MGLEQADQSCRVTRVKVEEPAASQCSFEASWGAIPLILASQLTRSREQKRRCHFVVMQFVKRPAASSEHWQGGLCIGSFGSKVSPSG